MTATHPFIIFWHLALVANALVEPYSPPQKTLFFLVNMRSSWGKTGRVCQTACTPAKPAPAAAWAISEVLGGARAARDCKDQGAHVGAPCRGVCPSAGSPPPAPHLPAVRGHMVANKRQSISCNQKLLGFCRATLPRASGWSKSA